MRPRLATAVFVVRRVLAAPLDLALLALAVLAYRARGATPDFGYQAMIRLHCLTRGRANDLWHAWIRRRSPAARAPRSAGKFDDPDFAANLREKGYHVFAARLDPSECAALREGLSRRVATTKPGNLRLAYDAAAPRDAGYYYDEADILDLPAAQALLADGGFATLAARHLGVAPVLSIVMAWWTVARPPSDASRRALAQLFHFDMDRPKWIKFFVYLTDVGPEGGPHALIVGSHRAGDPPYALLRHQYARLPDAEVAAHYPAERIQEIIGPAGTVFAADTRAFHRGRPPTRGDRLVLEFEFCDSLFGAAFDRPRLDPARQARLLGHRAAEPRLYSRFRA